METMKTTLEFPDTVFRRAKSKAAECGISLRQFVTEAVEDKLQRLSTSEDRPWMAYVGKLADLHEETTRIERIIEEEFEKIEPEMWTSEQ
jgi:hypothetical protein